VLFLKNIVAQIKLHLNLTSAGVATYRFLYSVLFAITVSCVLHVSHRNRRWKSRRCGRNKSSCLRAMMWLVSRWKCSLANSNSKIYVVHNIALNHHARSAVDIDTVGVGVVPIGWVAREVMSYTWFSGDNSIACAIHR